MDPHMQFCKASSHSSTGPSATGGCEKVTFSASADTMARIFFASSPSPKLTFLIASKHLIRWGCTAWGSRVCERISSSSSFDKK